MPARVSELPRAAARIGDVVELINAIAGQTNLKLEVSRCLDTVRAA